MTRRASSAVDAIGLSTTTACPAASAASARGTCVEFGVAITTRSCRDICENTSSGLLTTCAAGWSRLARPRRSGFDVTIVVNRRPGVIAMIGA
jgi:hypothetical protein